MFKFITLFIIALAVVGGVYLYQRPSNISQVDDDQTSVREANVEGVDVDYSENTSGLDPQTFEKSPPAQTNKPVVTIPPASVPVQFDLPKTDQNDDGAPLVTIKNPGHDTAVSGVLNIEAEANNPNPSTGLSRVEFYIDGVMIQQDSSAPFTATYDTHQRENGPMTLAVAAYNSANQWRKLTISVKVLNAPVIEQFSAQPTMVREGEEVVIQWKSILATRCVGAGDWTGNKMTSGSEPFTMYGNAKFTLTCINDGGKTSRSTEVSVDPVPPSITLTSPSSNSVATNIMTITANAVDNTFIDKVDFYIDELLVATDNQEPYITNYDTAQLKDNRYTVRVVATDRGGNTDEDTIIINTSNGNH